MAHKDIFCWLILILSQFKCCLTYCNAGQDETDIVQCCREKDVCDDPDEILMGIFHNDANRQRLHKTFDHINHRPPPYVLVTYALNTSTFPFPCDSIYGSGLLPGIRTAASKENNHSQKHQFEVWIWSTSPIHFIVSPFILVEFGLFTPWISYDVIYPNKSFSLVSDHGSVCVALPYQLPKKTMDYNLAKVTSRVCL